LTRRQIGGLLFLTFSLGYGLAATRIPSLPIDELEAMNARSLPYALTVLGSVLSLVLIFSPRASAHVDAPAKSGDWQTVGLLLVAISFYGLSLDALGFLLCTALFIAIAAVLLGERRWRRILSVSIILVGVLWLILVPGLGVYLAPGRLWQ